jgi:hypothetical protein
MNGFAFTPQLDRFFRRKKLDTDLDLRKIANSLSDRNEVIESVSANAERIVLQRNCT